MRLWVKESERRPSPAPVKTDDRKVLLVGIALWIAALAVMLVLLQPIIEAGAIWMLWTCVAGLALGVVGLLSLLVKPSKD
jgi:Na+/melibiose symporter-like transporter